MFSTVALAQSSEEPYVPSIFRPEKAIPVPPPPEPRYNPTYGQPYRPSIFSDTNMRSMPVAQPRRQESAGIESTVRTAPQAAAPPTSDESFFQPPSAKPWSAMLYGGVGTRSNLGEVLLFDIHFVDSQFIGGVINREMFRFFRQHFSFELEGQVIGHIGKQDNAEFNGLYIVRLNTFPWDRHVDTSFAVGSGLSYATSTPVIEEEEHPGETSQLMHYQMFELAFGLPLAIIETEKQLRLRLHQIRSA